MSLSYIDQEDGPTITIREDATGRWVSAMTSQWREIDEVLDGLLQNVAEGNMICHQREDGEFMFKMTARGEAKSEDMIGSDPDMAAFWAQVQRGHGQRPDLPPTAERVLVVLANDEATNVNELIEVTGYTRGQVLQALELLHELGFLEGAE